MNTVTVALHPQVPQFVQPSQINPVIQHNPNVAAGAAMSIPLGNFDVNSLAHTPNFGALPGVPNSVPNHLAPTPFIQQGKLHFNILY